MNRWIVMFVVVVVVLLLLACVGYFTGNWNEDESARPGYFGLASAETREEPLCMDEATRERIRGVMVDALDEALKSQVIHLFEVWLKDDRGQPERARTGVRHALKAYLGARKKTVEWMPPVCSG